MWFCEGKLKVKISHFLGAVRRPLSPPTFHSLQPDVSRNPRRFCLSATQANFSRCKYFIVARLARQWMKERGIIYVQSNLYFTITAEIYARSLPNFYCQYADRHMNLKIMRRVSEREPAIRQFVIVKNKLMSVFNESVLLLIMNFVITLSK